MSPVAYSRTAVVPSGSGMAPGASHAGGIAKNGVGGNAFGGAGGPGKAPFRHIDDLVYVGVDIDPHTPLRKMLEIGDNHMRQALTYTDFRRPDLALQEYIKATTIAVDKVPRHKDYPSMKSDRSDLNRLYNALKAKINDNGPTFDKIKEDIKQDNQRSGVEPTRPTPLSTAPSSIQPKSKPAIHPKPQALHGKAVKPPLEDLAARFAKLRNSQETRSRSSEASKPSGPRDMPVPQRSRPSVDSSVPSMPKLPDAIYSPARGTVTSEVVNLPSSTRGMFSRTNSIASAPSASARTSMENAIKSFNVDQFVTAHTYGERPATPRQPGITIPKGDSITVNELKDYMGKIQILIIDVRDRESFDEGHIMSQKTICVEPEVLSRENISADEIVDSMVLAPPKEKLAIEQRDKVDLVVIYDQESTAFPIRITSNSQEMILYNIREALSQYSFSRPLKNPPKLLVGGLAAWVDKLGTQSLETSNTMTANGAINSSSIRGTTRRQRNKTRTLDRKEVEQFEQIIKEGQEAASDFDYTRSREEFDRRFPSVSNIPESMSSAMPSLPPPGQAGRITELEEQNLLISLAPKPPSRPKPAVPRTRYSGLESHDDDSKANAIALMATTSPTVTRPRTGLYNPQNWCYANTAIQSLLATDGFIDELLAPEWPAIYIPTAAPNSPQLMCKILGNIFQWMSKRQFRMMKLTTLMHYLRSIHAGFPSETGKHELIRFGDKNQHDADEFIQFLFEQLHAETNQPVTSPFVWPLVKVSNDADTISNAWKFHISRNWSIIDRYWTIMTLNRLTCTSCSTVNYALDVPSRLGVTVDADGHGSLEKYIQQNYGVPQLRESQCDACGAREKRSECLFGRLPPSLCVQVGRTAFVNNNAVKNTKPFAFPFDNLDLAPYCFPDDAREAARDELYNCESSQDYAFLADGLAEESRYDLYAVITHSGNSPRSGHYWNHIRTGPNTWTRCNDSQVTDETSNPAEVKKLSNDMFNCANQATPVLLFYKRQDQSWHW
ncbi:hypothetical protein F4775DRAFT_537942 [Biscogniauxia sp. FL1348]|nr:hypothetical protein F4775DRAFT_537942 [Biscogniauxia sp. FL1348]